MGGLCGRVSHDGWRANVDRVLGWYDPVDSVELQRFYQHELREEVSPFEKAMLTSCVVEL